MTSGLVRRYSFGNFVRGEGNDLAVGCARAVAESPGAALNPLYVHGGRGVGKTHLLHALGNALEERGRRVAYLTAEGFTNGLIDAIGDAGLRSYMDAFRELDVLLLDDVQFLANKVRASEGLVGIVYELRLRGSQVVFAADRTPGRLVGFQEQMSTFLKWGMVVGLLPPERTVLESILRQEAQGQDLPEEVVTLLVERFPCDVGRLQGGLTRVMSHVRLRGLALTRENAVLALETP